MTGWTAQSLTYFAVPASPPRDKLPPNRPLGVAGGIMGNETSSQEKIGRRAFLNRAATVAGVATLGGQALSPGGAQVSGTKCPVDQTSHSMINHGLDDGEEKVRDV